MSRLVVVSNRIALPDDKKSSAGGLAVGILGALRAAGGLWSVSYTHLTLPTTSRV